MDVITVKYCELVNRFSSWLPTQWKAAIKNTIGWDLNRASPRVLRAIYVDQRLLAAMLELDPELAADDLRKEFGNLAKDFSPIALKTCFVVAVEICFARLIGGSRTRIVSAKKSKDWLALILAENERTL
jgi:hypothetical protein